MLSQRLGDPIRTALILDSVERENSHIGNNKSYVLP